MSSEESDEENEEVYNCKASPLEFTESVQSITLPKWQGEAVKVHSSQTAAKAKD